VPEEPFELSRFPVHLGFGATVVHLEEFGGSPQWYERYGEGRASALFVTAGLGTEMRMR
jgi:hypothetical protein